MKKPYVIIHTHTSLDGKIHAIDIPEFTTTAHQYQRLALDPEKHDKRVFNLQAYGNGRITTDDNFTHYRKPNLDENAAEVPEGDFVADAEAPMYYLSIDASGTLGWTENYVDHGNVRAHVIEILTERATNAYKDFLRRMNISYIIAGEEELDKALVLHKLATLFNMEQIMIGGGGLLNWSYLQDGFVDEVSIVMAPIADGDPDAQSLFTAREPFSTIQPFSFTLLDVQKLEDNAVWLRYKVNY